jgi:3-oxoacyl-[acyl-carrier-protein] synthase II
MIYRGRDQYSRRVNAPQAASRPFDRDRDGAVAGEGAGAIVLETGSSLQHRGGQAQARLAGWAQGFCSLNSERFPHRVVEVCEQALAHANLSVMELGQFNAHGTSQPLSDRLEASAICKLAPEVPLLACKHNFGSLGPGGGTVELIAGILAMQRGILPGAINFAASDTGFTLNLSSSTRQHAHSSLLKLSFSPTGQIAALVVTLP